MEKKSFTEMTDDELLVEKDKLKKSKIFHATMIGFLAGILIFGLVGWGLSEEKRLGFFIPMLIPMLIIYRLVKNPKGNKDLEEALKERRLN
ncbi:hypothetical protein [Aquiflexum gelatinilyticum]|uniref:FUSC family protein n=1 Tax=Aquiflexum gelatinilyticum TaxID=2961943 RepID=A0A9X2T0E6_9BACT|nr:hypothetical protein [Aquiflexum gelatinilyticum]MCR9013805.1 hypothetical protein [Aquiflexum gelatinilyticum]